MELLGKANRRSSLVLLGLS